MHFFVLIPGKGFSEWWYLWSRGFPWLPRVWVLCWVLCLLVPWLTCSHRASFNGTFQDENLHPLTRHIWCSTKYPWPDSLSAAIAGYIWFITNYHSFIGLRVDQDLIEVKFITTLRLQLWVDSWDPFQHPYSSWIYTLGIIYIHLEFHVLLGVQFCWEIM